MGGAYAHCFSGIERCEGLAHIVYRIRVFQFFSEHYHAVADLPIWKRRGDFVVLSAACAGCNKDKINCESSHNALFLVT
jgi:hypothetical protein